MLKYLVLATVFLTGCHVIPKHYEDENVYVVNHKGYIRHADKLTAEQKEQVEKDYTAPFLDENEKKALKGRAFGEAGDLITTAIGFSKGCVEANPIVGTSMVNVVLVKGVGYYTARQYAKASPKMFSSAKQLKNGNYILFGVVAWNLYQISQGCIG
jgi:hypothetical protein